MKSNKPEGVWRTLRITIILLVANLLLVTNLYIYSMYVSNQSMQMAMSAQSAIDITSGKSSKNKEPEKSLTINSALSYDIPDDYQVMAKNVTWPLDAAGLKNRITNCESTVESSLITSTADSYQDTKGIEYTFTKDSLKGSYTVTVFPNKRFSTLDEAKQIFSVCPDGGQMIPINLSASTILFADSCGTGAGSDVCNVIKSTVDSSLSIR